MPCGTKHKPKKPDLHDSFLVKFARFCALCQPARTRGNPPKKHSFARRVFFSLSSMGGGRGKVRLTFFVLVVSIGYEAYTYYSCFFR